MRNKHIKRISSNEAVALVEFEQNLDQDLKKERRANRIAVSYWFSGMFLGGLFGMLLEHALVGIFVGSVLGIGAWIIVQRNSTV